MDDDSSKALGLSDEAALAPLGNVIPPQLAAEIEAARSYRARSKAANTVRAYDSDWRQFEEWCWVRDLEPMPAMPEAVATYLASLAQAGRADSTIGRALLQTWGTAARRHPVGGLGSIGEMLIEHNHGFGQGRGSNSECSFNQAHLPHDTWLQAPCLGLSFA